MLLLPSLALAYSFFAPRGLGEATNLSHARWVGLGSPEGISHQNPALGVWLRTPTFYLTGLYELVYGIEGDKARGSTDLRIPGLGASIPLGLGFGLGVRLDERFNQDFDLYSPVVDGEFEYRHHVVGRGGIYRAGFSAWKRCLNSLGLGIEYGWMFGGSTEYWALSPEEGGPLIADTIALAYSGGGFRAGGVIRVGIFELASFYETRAELGLSGRVSSPAGEHRYSGELSLPGSYGVGVRFEPAPRMGLLFDFYSLPYEEIEVGGYRGNRYSLGVEYWLSPRVPLRFGLRSGEWYTRAAEGEVIHEDALSIGSLIPIRGWGGFHYSLEVVHRQGGEMGEWGARLVTTLSFEEEWRLRERRWGW